MGFEKFSLQTSELRFRDVDEPSYQVIVFENRSECARQTERERQRERDRDRETETERQRERDRDGERQTKLNNR